jgi:hypothetical protein
MAKIKPKLVPKAELMRLYNREVRERRKAQSVAKLRRSELSKLRYAQNHLAQQKNLIDRVASFRNRLSDIGIKEIFGGDIHINFKKFVAALDLTNRKALSTMLAKRSG